LLIQKRVRLFMDETNEPLCSNWRKNA
jgi:hypothetical protein